MADPIIVCEFGGLTFSNQNGTFTLDENSPQGWYGGPPVRSEVEDRPNANGAFGVTRVYKGARVISLSGLIHAQDQDSAMVDPWLALSGLQSNGAPSEFTVTDASGMKSATVTLADKPDVIPGVNGTSAYTLQLIARDPVKYGETQTASTGLPTAGGGLEYPLGSPSGALYYGALGNLGRVTLANSGTADTWPVFTVTGQLDDGFQILCLDSGQALRYDRVVPAGTSVSIDSRTGEVLIDGVSDASTYLTRAEFFPVPAMGSCEVQFSAVSTGSGASMTAEHRSGWW